MNDAGCICTAGFDPRSIASYESSGTRPDHSARRVFMARTMARGTPIFASIDGPRAVD
jgi:hypothetical protein